MKTRNTLILMLCCACPLESGDRYDHAVEKAEKICTNNCEGVNCKLQHVIVKPHMDTYVQQCVCLCDGETLFLEKREAQFRGDHE